jgi:hypothetical protein
MKYAVNVLDLTYAPEIPRACMFGPICKKDGIFMTNAQYIDSGAVVMECPDTQAEAVMDCIPLIFRGRPQPRQGFIRFYRQGPRGGWKELRIRTHKEETDARE